MYTDLGLYIDGKWLNGEGRKGEDVINPATGKTLAHLPHASKADLDAALAAAEKGFQVWKNTSAYDRSKIMRKAADLLRERFDHVSKVQTQEQGKVYVESRAEVLTSRRHHRLVRRGRPPHLRPRRSGPPEGRAPARAAGAGRHRRGVHTVEFPDAHPGAQDRRRARGRLLDHHQGLGRNPGRRVELVKCFADAGLPAGVLNLVFGVPADVSEHLIPQKVVKKISFTGSIPVGKHLAQLAAKGMKKATMELGGHSPVVVFDDADPEKAADTIAAFKYRNAGQVCISPTRFYVQEKDYSKFLARFTEYAKGLKMGDGLEKGITLGPLANPRRLDAMDSFVTDAKNRGGKVVTGGSREGNQGFFFQPTVITDVPDDSKIMTEEPFGPVAPIVSFKTFDEVVERANSLQFGLAAYAFTTSDKTAAAIGDAMQSGMVGVNSVAVSTPETPFGGIKESGYGSEGGMEGLQAYMNVKFISQG